MDFGCYAGIDRWMLEEEQELRNVMQRLVIQVQMVWFEKWNCLQDSWCCPFNCGGCTLNFGRERVP